jgi:hypothetical protein
MNERGRTLRAAVLLIGVVSLGGCALLLPQPSLDSVPRGGSLPLPFFAGAARVALTPVSHPVPLAGFGPHPVLASAAESDLHARAVSLRGSAEITSGVTRVVLVSVDMLIVTREVARAVRERTSDLPGTRVVVAATHTHNGIGGFWSGGLPEWASVGAYDAAETARVVSLVASAVREAVRREEPVTVAWVGTSCPAFVESRVASIHTTDPELSVLALDGPRGAQIARLVFFAAHPTELYGTGVLSPAWPGALSSELEAAGGVTLLFQQGLGDQRPTFPPEVYANMGPITSSGRIAKSRAYGKTLANRVRRALGEAHWSAAAELRFERAPFDLPPPSLGACPIPLLDRAIAMPVVLPYWPHRTHVSALRIGDGVAVFAPFELCAASSLRAKRELRQAGFKEAAVASLADDWLGYAPDFLPLPWTTSGVASFGGTGMGYSVGERLVALGERLRD